MIKFLDLKRENERFQPDVGLACNNVIDSGWYLNGKHLENFEHDFSHYCGVKHAVGVGTGLDALTLILKAWIKMGKLNEGDDVLVPANTFIATALAVTNNNLNVILVEPESTTFNISVKTIRQAITKNTKAIIPVHLYGQLAPMLEIMAFAHQNNLLVLEDAAQAVGAKNKSGSAGTLGNAAAFSFYPGKNLGALGDGGMVTTNDIDVANMVRTLANYGSNEKYLHKELGTNSRLDEIQAAILNIKLPFLDRDNQRRTTLAKHYLEKIKNPKITLPVVNKDNSHVWHLFVIKTNERDKLQKHLKDNGIETLIHYPISIHKQPAYSHLAKLNFPCTEMLQENILSLPIYPTLTDEEQIKVINTINLF